MTTDIEAMFDTPSDGVEATVDQLAQDIARDDERLEQLKYEAKNLEDNIKARKRDLAMMLISNGMDSVKLACGLSPRAKTIRKFFKAAGVSDEHLHAWLEANDLGGIIKPTVHFQTLQSTLAQYEEQGGAIPDTLFTVTDEPTIVLYGKSKYLNSKEQRQ